MRIKIGIVKAFTIQELMVVMAITSIVVGMAFSVLNLVQKQMGAIQDIQEMKLETNKLKQSLWIDFNRFSYIYFDQNKEQLFFSSALEEKSYTIGDHIILTEKDTFYIQLDVIKFYFDNQVIQTGEIDAVEFKTSKETGFQKLFVFKNNAPATYINR